MALLSTDKSKAGLKAAKSLADRPRHLIAGANAAQPANTLSPAISKPYIRQQARQSAAKVREAKRILGETLAVHAPQAAYRLGLAQPPKPKRTAPRVAAGAVIGAGAVYFLEPEHGRERRQKVAHLVS